MSPDDPTPEAALEDLEPSEDESADVKGGGKVSVHDISITKNTDKGSP